MPILEILASRLGPAARAEAEGPIMDVCDDTRAPIDFSCRSASCGTCRVRVLEGAELLDPAREDEREVLAIFASPPDARLACQARARPGEGVIRLAWIDD